MEYASSTGQRIVKAVIPAAGRGTRLGPMTRALPKEMLPVGRWPVVHHICQELKAAGADSVLIVTARGKSAIEDYFDGIDGGDEAIPRPMYVRQSVPRGLGDAVLMAEGYAADSPFYVALGDTIMGEPSPGCLLTRMQEAYHATRADMAIAVQRVPAEATRRYGVVEPIPGSATDSPFLIREIVEKPQPAAAPSNLAVAARYILGPRIFDDLRRAEDATTDREVTLTDALRLCLREGGTVCCVPLAEGEMRHDAGNFGTYFRTFVTFALRDEEHGPALREFVVGLQHDGRTPRHTP